MWPYRRSRALAVYALAALNIGALWAKRGPYLPGWDLFGATFGVLALNEADSFRDALGRVTAAFLAQRERLVFTGGESYVHGLLPGLLNEASPSLVWGNVVCLALVVLILAWLARRLPCRLDILWACMVASPALVSQSIVGLPHLSSTAIPFGLAIGHCLTEARSPRPLRRAALADLAVFAGITFYAFNGYESGKTFWVIPIVAALTLPDVALPRRILWGVLALAIARLTYETRAMTTVTALSAVPRDPWAFLDGIARIPQRYLVDWWIDFPALPFAALFALVLLRRHRLFWAATLLVAAGLVSLSAFQFEGGFLAPHRFLLLIFLCALVVAIALSEDRPAGALSRVVVGLLAVGALYTTWTTIRFVGEPRTYARRNYNNERVYPLPYNRSGFENHLWLDRVHDAATAVDLIEGGDERHLFLYGFSVVGEDGVNPQLFVSRILLPLGYDRFVERVAFFDYEDEMFFQFPIRPVGDFPDALAETPTPFLLHVREPEYSGASVVARLLNRATVTPVDVGLIGFQSYRVSAYAAPGPIPIQPPDAATSARIAGAIPGLVDGFCVTTWSQETVGYSPLHHWEEPIGSHLDTLLQLAASGTRPTHYAAAVRRHVLDLDLDLTPSSVAHVQAYVDNPSGGPLSARFVTTTEDEVAVVVNGQTLEEYRGLREPTRYETTGILPPGTSELRLLSHNFFESGRLTFHATGPDGAPLRWRCPGDFGRDEAAQ